MNIKQLKRISDRAAAEYKSRIGERDELTGCMLATTLISEKLSTEEVDFECVLGQASFGFNASERGCIDYGYSVESAAEVLALIADGSLRIRDLPMLPGHAWVEVDDYVVDLTLLTLKTTIRNDDRASGVSSGSFKLDLSTAPVMHENRLVSRNHIRDGGIGAHYNGHHRFSRQAFLQLV